MGLSLDPCRKPQTTSLEFIMDRATTLYPTRPQRKKRQRSCIRSDQVEGKFLRSNSTFQLPFSLLRCLSPFRALVPASKWRKWARAWSLLTIGPGSGKPGFPLGSFVCSLAFPCMPGKKARKEITRFAHNVWCVCLVSRMRRDREKHTGAIVLVVLIRLSLRMETSFRAPFAYGEYVYAAIRSLTLTAPGVGKRRRDVAAYATTAVFSI